MVPAQVLEKTTATVVGFSSARDGGFWLLLGSELRKYSHGTEVARRVLPESPGVPWSMTEDSRGDVWICTIDRGLCQVSPDERMVRWDEESGLSYHGTRFVFEDRESNLWVGTSGGGLQRFKQRRFQNFGTESGIEERVVKSVSPAPGEGVWVSTYGKGLFRWTEDGVTSVPLTGSNVSLYAQSVLADRSGRTWVGTFGADLFMLHANGSRHFPPAQTAGNDIVALFEDSHGRVWVSGGEGISVFEGETFRIYDGERGSAVKGVCCFGEDNAGLVWFSNIEKVYRLEADQFVEVMDDYGKPLRGITFLKGEPDGAMWMGSMGAGLLRWRKGNLTRIGADAGLPMPNIYGIVEDDQGFWWMPSNRGVLRVRRSDLQSVADGTSQKLAGQLLDASDGLAAIECTGGLQPVCARDAKGRLWFATIKGVAMTEPARFRLNSIVPKTSIDEIAGRVEGRFLKELELPAGCRGIEIHYSAPTFVSPEKEKFQISLDGILQDWQDAGNRRAAYFDELQPGEHTFRVRASNDDGVWDEAGANLVFTVLPFFWQTGQFRALLMAGIFGGALVWGYRLMRRLDRKRAMQEAFTRQLILSQENERKRVASDLHDGVGQDLLLLKNRVGLLAASSKQSPELARKLGEISADASRAINEIREISHALRPTALEQVGFTRAVEWMVEQLGNTSTSTKFSTELQDIDGLLPSDQEISLYRIIQEGLSNATRHAQASRVIVEVRQEAGRLLVSLFDDGRGFEAGNHNGNGHFRPGFGLAGMAERAKVLGGRIEIQSEAGKGTRLTVTAPLPRCRQD
jgi:signal transduction histidine kinase/sugar lactone lactonase YvrE